MAQRAGAALARWPRSPRTSRRSSTSSPPSSRRSGVLREVSPGTLDVVAAMGELLSSRIVADALVHAGLPGEWVDARLAIVTNDDYTRAMPLMRETTAALRAVVSPLVDAGRVPGARRVRRARRLRGAYDDARTWRIGLFGRDRRRRHRCRARFRSGPTWTGC